MKTKKLIIIALTIVVILIILLSLISSSKTRSIQQQKTTPVITPTRKVIIPSVMINKDTFLKYREIGETQKENTKTRTETIIFDQGKQIQIQVRKT